MKVPDSASDKPETGGLPDTDEEYIPNRYAAKDLLTRHEAIDLINHLSGALLADGYNRRRPQSKPQD